MSAAAPGRATKTKFLVGLIGEGIQGSRSPALHEQEARCHGLTLHYELIDLAEGGQSIADLPRLIESAQATGFTPPAFAITHTLRSSICLAIRPMSGGKSRA